MKDYPIRFSRQKVLGKYSADFYCAKAKLIVELDGAQHFREEGRKYDAERTAYLDAYDLTVLRISNYDINRNFSGVCKYIDTMVRKFLHH